MTRHGPVRFEFSTAGRIVFGAGAVNELPALARELGSRAFVVTGATPDRHAHVLAALASRGLDAHVFAVSGEPTVEVIREAAARAGQSGSEVVIAIGGGSALDAGKAVAAMSANPGDVLEYLEVVGRGEPLRMPPLPMIAVPTTAGTGSEVTRNAVLGVPDHRVKASLRSPLMLPRIAIVDPDLTMGVPRSITASTGLDALTQLIEPFVSMRANPLTDAFCRDGIRTIAGSLRRAIDDGRDRDARHGMSYASLLGGLALTNAGLGVVHGLAAPIGGMFDAPHGAVCAALLARGMAANLQALRARAPQSPALARYDEIGRVLTGAPDAGAEDGILWVQALVAHAGIPPLSSYGVARTHAADVARRAAATSSLKTNPIVLTQDELEGMVLASSP